MNNVTQMSGACDACVDNVYTGKDKKIVGVKDRAALILGMQEILSRLDDCIYNSCNEHRAGESTVSLL